MKKRLFLIAVFLVLITNIIFNQERAEKYYKSHARETIITEKTISLYSDEAVIEMIPGFIVPMVFIFSACIFTFVGHTEFKIGTVVWKPKHRKQLPRGSLA